MAAKMDTQPSDMNYMIGWFQTWTFSQRMIFLESLVAKIVPDKLFAQASRLNMGSPDSPQARQADNQGHDPSQCKLFYEQLLYSQIRIDEWSADDSNRFLNMLEEIDRIALYRFYDMIAATVGEV